jgi:hypothetical protein
MVKKRISLSKDHTGNPIDISDVSNSITVHLSTFNVQIMLNESHDGGLVIRTLDGLISVHPESANSISIRES